MSIGNQCEQNLKRGREHFFSTISSVRNLHKSRNAHIHLYIHCTNHIIIIIIYLCMDSCINNNVKFGKFPLLQCMWHKPLVVLRSFGFNLNMRTENMYYLRPSNVTNILSSIHANAQIKWFEMHIENTMLYKCTEMSIAPWSRSPDDSNSACSLLCSVHCSYSRVMFSILECACFFYSNYHYYYC